MLPKCREICSRLLSLDKNVDHMADSSVKAEADKDTTCAADLGEASNVQKVTREGKDVPVKDTNIIKDVMGI